MRTLASILLIVVASGCGKRPEATIDAWTASAIAAKYLWSKQGPDGGWHSETYGLLRSGQSLTPFVLIALLDAPSPSQEGIDRAIAFIRANTNREGELGRSDPSLEDYPNYATALAARAMRLARREEGIDRRTPALVRQQFAEQNGWTKEHPAYGAWGMGGPIRTPPFTGHVDLSMTRHVLEGGVPAEARMRAFTFLERCQNPDGGFMFSPVIADANKAGTGRSYGTATADGFL